MAIDAGPAEAPSKQAIMLAPEAPYPIAGGGALRTASLLHHLARSYAVDLIVFRQPGAPDPLDMLPAGLVQRMTVIGLPANARGFAARAWRNAGRLSRAVPPLVDRFSGFEREIENAISGRRYEIGIVEHFWCAPYWQQISNACSRTVLDLHNIESCLHGGCADVEGPAAGFAHRLFRDASRDLERQWLPRYSRVLAPSAADAGRALQIAPGSAVSVYPNAIPFAPLPPGGGDEAVVFSGNMEYHPNRTAVRFFREQVWPRLRDRWPKLVWRLVGKNPDAVRDLVSGDPRIEVRGPVVNALEELARGRVAVAPLLAGSGTRFKIIEAWAAGVPVVSTTIGAEGLPYSDGENLFLADNGPAFSESVSRLLACSTLRERLGMNGRALVEKEFTWETAWQRLDF